jgi:hypothetical protein
VSRDKQIEEMAYEMTQYKEPVCKRIEDNKCLLRFHAHAFVDCHFCKLAEHLITEKGYRKASEVAEEIFAEIEKLIARRMIPDVALIDDRLIIDITKLKKKYTESEDTE